MISLSNLRTVCKKALEPDFRISKNALLLLKEKCISQLKKITKQTKLIANNSGRITIKPDDVEFFYKNLNGTSLFHKNSIEKAMKSFGAQRISKKTIETTALALEMFVNEVIKPASKIAKHAKRKTIKKTDITIAIETTFHEKILKLI